MASLHWFDGFGVLLSTGFTGVIEAEDIQYGIFEPIIDTAGAGSAPRIIYSSLSDPQLQDYDHYFIRVRVAIIVSGDDAIFTVVDYLKTLYDTLNGGIGECNGFTFDYIERIDGGAGSPKKQDDGSFMGYHDYRLFYHEEI